MLLFFHTKLIDLKGLVSLRVAEMMTFVQNLMSRFIAVRFLNAVHFKGARQM